MKTFMACAILGIAAIISLNGCSVFDKKEVKTTDYNLLASYEDTNSKQTVAITLQFHSLSACETEINKLTEFSKTVCKADKRGCLSLLNAICIDSQTGEVQ